MKLMPLYCLLFVFQLSFSQSQLGVNDGTLFMDDLRSKRVSANAKYANATGSMYIHDGFLPFYLDGFGEIVFMGRYNAFSGEMEFKKDGDETPIALNPSQQKFIVKFRTLNKTYQNFTYIEDGKNLIAFFIHVSLNNKVSLLKRESIKYIPATEAKSGYQRSKPAKFERQDDRYYIRIEDGNPLALPSNKKKLAAMFPNHSKDILAYIKAEKLKLNVEQDLVKLIRHIDTL